MNRTTKMKTILDLLAGKPKTITLKYIESPNRKDIYVLGRFSQKQIDLINSGKVKIIEDLSMLSDEMLFRMNNGYQPKVYYNRCSV